MFANHTQGTVLGATFSAMNPDRVSRVILDGVVDTDDYYNGSHGGPRIIKFLLTGSRHVVD